MADTVKGVDISVWNGDVDFEMLKRNGISFVMIGMGNRFAENVQKAEAAGMPWGGYFYTDSVSPAEDEEELAKILDRLKGKRPTYPIAIDVEDDGTKAAKGGWNYANVNRNAKFLLEGLEKAGYYPMLYTGFEEIENYIDESVWRKYDMWWAQWATRCGYPGDNLGMWQFGGETNYICSPYIEGEIFDQNYAYKDYPTIIKSGGWNNWGTPEPLPDYPDDFPPYQDGTVKDVQEWLNSVYNAQLEIDGICGQLTKKALISVLQTILNDTYGAGLDVDGIFGRKTRAAIRNLSNGDTGDYVRVLQGFLIGRGQDTGGFDGIFGNATESAVRTFQTVKGLTVDGIAGKNTFEALARE
jgi:hypothetical protein